MGRWEPGARDRLALAAMELYGERGYQCASVAEIARRAGLTERTFFRHFTDKAEVLFAGTHLLEETLVASVRAAPGELGPIGAVVHALNLVAVEVFEQRRDFACQRQGIIVANPELRQRELAKMATLATSVARALRDRGAREPAASLAAEAGIAIFRVAFGRWIDDADGRSLAAFVRETADELARLTALP
ncbi:TetR family transcriptional regulator [Frankia sp. AiPs1]|uniref:TetR/AcrR family transcriptional regulator n=1 Tax=Frankia sp. AiPa1 TaxID=573492 RepID=UPI00202B2491|nr:TetR/AcrR family transcriptional regulator [Frankia sp. AiPa1]MCL9762870.1 TetR/AcrR family transcriptional regulator [Frankia sp. AiPa1]